MGTGATELDVWNLTLDMLSQSRIITDAEKTANNTPEARFFDRNFDRSVRRELRANIWSFAKVSDELSADATDPDFDYSYRYLMPGSWVRLLPITERGDKGGALVPFELFGRYIHTDHGEPLRVHGIDYLSDPDLWDDMFIEVVAARLATLYAVKLTGKTDYLGIATDTYARAVDEAARIGAVEDFPDPVETHDILRAREL